jgi:putative membrane protein
MSMVASILVGLLAVEHVWAMVLEMFLWTRPLGLKAFGNTPENAQLMAVLAKNQGLYNGFLAVGLFWGLWLGNSGEGWHIRLFFSGCVLVAGLYGYATTRKGTILVGQAGLGALTLILVWLTRGA